jgi:hypothetical protein
MIYNFRNLLSKQSTLLKRPKFIAGSAEGPLANMKTGEIARTLPFRVCIQIG